MAKNPFDVAIEQFIREDSEMLSVESSTESGSCDKSDQAVPVCSTVDDDQSKNEVLTVSNEVIVSTSSQEIPSPLIMNSQEDFSGSKNQSDVKNYTNAVQLLLNYDKAKDTAIPVGPIRNSGAVVTAASVTPITIIGYNYFSLIPTAHIMAQPLTVVTPAADVSLKCDEKLPSSNESTQDPDQSEAGVDGSLSHHGSYACSLCDSKFFTKEYLQYHLMKAHGVKIGQAQDSSTTSSVSSATVSVSTDRAFRCSLCPKTYSYLRNLRKHELTYHSSERIEKVRMKSAEKHEHCRVCRQQFPDRGALMIHMKSHVSTCQICYKIFGSNRGLKLHSVIHDGKNGKQFGCTVCGKCYSHSRSLKQHMKRHGAEPELQCRTKENNVQQEPGGPSVHAVKTEVANGKSGVEKFEYHVVERQTEHELDLQADFQAFSFGSVEAPLD